MKFHVTRAACLLSGVCLSSAFSGSGAHSRMQKFLTPNARNRVLNLAQQSANMRPALKAQTPVRIAQNDAQLANLEKQMAQMVNAARRNANLSPLTFDENLSQVARAHSLEMRDKKYFAHESPMPNLRDPLDRYRAAFGQTPAMVAENVYRAWSSAPQKVTLKSIQAAHASLMNSPHHRENILRDGVQRLGIGVVVNQNGDIWVTQMFSRPRW